MKPDEKHHIRNTTQGLRFVCRKLSKTRDKHNDTAKEISESISDIEFYARRLDRCVMGKATSKHIAVFNRYSDLELLTMLLIGEAEGEPWESKVGVGLTVANRVKARKKFFGIGWRGVMLSSTTSGQAQFACFSSTKRVRSMIKHWRTRSSLWQEHSNIAMAIYLDMVTDFVGRPLFYHSSSFKPSGWWKGLVELGRFGNHIFYTDPNM